MKTAARLLAEAATAVIMLCVAAIAVAAMPIMLVCHLLMALDPANEDEGNTPTTTLKTTTP